MDKAVFAPELIIPSGTMDVDFYIHGLGATELRRFSNDDGSIHVSELSINGTLFHLHQEGKNAPDPKKLGGVSCVTGLFVEDVDLVMDRAMGATIFSTAQDYDYGYRQGQFTDPHGHRWQIQSTIK